MLTHTDNKWLEKTFVDSFNYWEKCRPENMHLSPNISKWNNFDRAKLLAEYDLNAEMRTILLHFSRPFTAKIGIIIKHEEKVVWK